MINVAFWISNQNIRDVDLSDVEHGNPGVGGTEFSAVLIASKIQCQGTIKSTLLCQSEGNFPSGLKYKICKDVFQAANYCRKSKIDFFVVDSRDLKEELLACFPTVRFLAWGNCFADGWMYDVFPLYKNLLKFICVGKSQFHLMLSTSLSNKSCYIYNAVPEPAYLEVNNFSIRKKRGNNVVYIGSLHKAKGFHILAKAWPEVLKKVPDANLYVIGSGMLYGRNVKLGEWGIASEEYESEFIPYVTDKGRIMDSVHFLGIMGQEKYNVLARCKVGVPNPSGESETFGYTAVEMQMMGCQVTTIKCPGYIDTVFNKQNLYDNTTELASRLVELLQSTNMQVEGCNGFMQIFSVKSVVNEWRDLLFELDKTKFSPSFNYQKAVRFYICYKFRYIKKKIRKILHR